MPGNHDWYDSLVSFARTFCRPERGFAGGRTRQTRSYFALQLPGRWWLLGIDLQLGADFDEPQIRYFRDVAARMTDPAHIILCVPEPQWIYAENYPDDRSYSGEVLEYFEREILQRPIAVFLTGDLHFYKRHENAAGVQKIVAGGGGAFLHPTHAPRLRTLQGGFRQRACYPPPAVSRRLVWRNLLFPALNPRYLPIPATLYTLSAWFASASLTSADIGSIDRALRAAINGAVRDPFNGLWLMTFVTAFVFFTDTHSRIYRISGGIAHALAHLFAAFGLGWLAVQLTTKALGLRFGDLPQMLLSAALTFVGGGIAGALILGVYLLVSWRVFGRHANEAFSSLRIQDYKHWLRGCVDPDGRLRLFAIAVDRVPRRWKRRKSGADRALEPQDGAAGTPRLIEWLRLQPRGGGQYAVDGVDERGRRYRRGSTSNDAPAKGIR
ncbi:MAG: hypothetical protein RML32_06245 [Gammaproteobacteria bacterium]|nr:hypothetical protein [Gammaproteobacteria bacterium]